MRPELLNALFTEVRALKGVGPGLEKPLARLGIERVKDLLYHLPTGFVERCPVLDLDAANVGDQVVVTLTAIEHRGGGSPRAPHRVLAQDRIGNVAGIVYFGRGGAGLARKRHPIGEARRVAGRLDRYGDMLQIVHPDHVDEGETALPLIEPVYPLAEGITGGRLHAMVLQGLERAPALEEWIEPTLLASRKWLAWRDALTIAHSRPDPDARDRLAYDELFAHQLAMRLVRAANDRRRTQPIVGDGHLVEALKLPWPLTGAQRRTIGEIEGDLAQARPMLRLLQGDVGAGKTAVALIALLRAVEAGLQGALLAPTEILARQHADNLQRMVAGLPVTIALLTGREKGRARESVLMGLADGSIDILVGTHAIFQESVSYRRLGLAVIDEQHRFGVSQRLLLTQKAATTPHLLAMTATPIPRTLTLALYGEMDVSRIDELPLGRSPVDTRVIADERMGDVIDGLARHVAGGGQAFWVCPLVDGGEDDAPAAAEQRAAMLRLRFGGGVGLVHGRMKGADKDRVMADFSSGALSVLVATTVIEVGVDVPNASLMIIEAADRFGLAQLHQLRGRVGRGSAQSVCLLLRGERPSETARARLSLMRETNDGFKIAEEDLRLRGAGEMLGTRQSGEAAFRVADEAQVAALIEVASDDARLLVERDGGLAGPRGAAARLLLYLFERDQGVALLRGG